MPATPAEERSMIELTVAELAEVTELDLGTSPWRRVDQAMLDLFGSGSSGFLAVSLVPVMFKEILRIKDHARGTNYGLDNVRFPAPVPVGDDVRLAASIVDPVRRDDGGVRYRLRLRVEIRGQDQPAVVGESTYLTYAG
jgi:acyl dehydratase